MHIVDSSRMRHRRTFIAAIGTIGTIVVAGCSTDRVERSPEDAVEQYFEAAAEGDTEKATAVVHPESGLYPVSERDLSGRSEHTLTNTERMSTDELVSHINTYVSPYSDSEYLNISKEEVNEVIEEIKSGTSIDETTFIMVTYRSDGMTEDVPFTMGKDGYDWKIISTRYL